MSPFVLEIVFAHVNELRLQAVIMPEHLTACQKARWQARQMADFLLATLFEKHNLPAKWLTQIQRSPSGRPFIEHGEIDFNISHSGDWVAVIFCRHLAKRQVGIDIEQPQKPRRYRDLLTHYATPQEINGLLTHNHTPFERLQDRFYLSWCLHEAVLKSQGKGIVGLSEVLHLPEKRQIFSHYCPQGWLHFYHQLPFYLCYFFENTDNLLPQISEWKNGNLQKIADIQPLVYHVNRGSSYAK